MNILKMLCRGADSTYLVDAADFDGTNDYMLRGAGLTGAADSDTGILSAWFRIDGGDGATVRILTNADNTVIISKANTDVFRISVSGTNVSLTFETVATYLAGAAWRHVLASWSTNFGAGSKLSHLYINDVSDKTVTADTGTGGNVDYTSTDWGICASTGGATPFNGCVAEFYFAPGQFLDFSTEANRRKFISATGKPVDLDVDGSTPTGVAPLVYQRVADGAAVATFATNLGTGGNFSITGTLDTASTSPSD